jgi:hypothetical protein
MTASALTPAAPSQAPAAVKSHARTPFFSESHASGELLTIVAH